eukprot:5772039-Pleurochrysis_carterae.AAC.2
MHPTHASIKAHQLSHARAHVCIHRQTGTGTGTDEYRYVHTQANTHRSSPHGCCALPYSVAIATDPDWHCAAHCIRFSHGIE